MGSRRRLIRSLCCVVAGPLLMALAVPAQAADVRIGVLALRGPDKAGEMWVATARYLEHRLPGNNFRIVPLGFDEVRLAVRQGSVDFVLINSSYYIELESLYGVSAIATLKNGDLGGPGQSTFGGVLFTRSDRADVRTLVDLHDKRFAAVDPSSFGGWVAASRELRRNGLDADHDFKRLSFEGTHDAVVYAVRDGRADAGTVRSDTLERMAAEGKISLNDFYVLNRQYPQGFPLLLSTALYPEWPIAKLRHVPDDLAVRVAIALMQMPAGDPAARAGMITGWTLPLNYQPVHEAMRELRIGPYENQRRLSFAEVLTQYGRWLAGVVALALFILAAAVYLSRVNRRLVANHSQLRESNTSLEQTVRARSEEVLDLLQRERFLRGVVEMVADVNQILVTSTSMEEMLKACCDRLAVHSNYRFAWCGMLREGRIVMAAKSYGPAELTRGVAACPERGPVRKALADNRTVIEKNVAAVCTDMVAAGVRAIIALPLCRDAYAEPLGNLCVLSGREEGFDSEEVAMLEQLAGDIGFAVYAFTQQAETRRLQQERISNYEEVILSLVDMIESRDTYTAGHTRRVARYSQLIAVHLGHTAEEVERLKRAAVLHDIGKISIPDAVLLKPGRLSPLEFELIKQHAEEGYRTLMRIEMYKELAEIMRSHHERENGSGYPRGLTSTQIPRLAKILAVADSFDAMTTNRIYKPRKEVAVALNELRQLAGEYYAADVVEAACTVLRDEQPPPVADQLPKTPVERQRFAYFFDDPLTGAHNASYLQFMLRNGLPSRLKFAYLVQLTSFSSINMAGGWRAGNEALAGFGATLLAHHPDALVFRVMGDDFVLLAAAPQRLDGALLKAQSPLQNTPVEVAVREMDLGGAGREYLQQLM